MIVHTCNPSIRGIEAERSRVWGQSCKYRKFQASLGFRTLTQNNKEKGKGRERKKGGGGGEKEKEGKKEKEGRKEQEPYLNHSREKSLLRDQVAVYDWLSLSSHLICLVGTQVYGATSA
jgi:hypothetical protein